MTGTSQRAQHERTSPAPAAGHVPCPRLGGLSCQRGDAHARGHVYHGAWAPDRHDLQD